LLFILFIADIEEYLKARKEGGIVIGKKKIYTLAYADDLGAIAESEEEMKSILKSLEKYFDRKELLLNAEKSKIMVFCKREKRLNRNWKWKGESIDEVREFKYLGFTFMKNNKDDAHIKEVKKRAAAAMAQIWGIGERKFGGDVDRRIMMFNILVKSILMYGVEIWGWEEKTEIESLQERYMRWILGLDRWTPGYVVREELKLENISIEAGYRALKFQEKMKRQAGDKLLRECRRENAKGYWRHTRWGKAMELLYKEGGHEHWEWEAKDDKGENIIDEWMGNMKKKKMEERMKKIEDSKSAKEYKKWRQEERPRYLKIKGKGKKIKTIARFRCCNEWTGDKYWEKEEEKLCRICRKERETWEHIWRECDTRSNKKEEEIMMGEEFRSEPDIEWMLQVIQMRGRQKEERKEREGSAGRKGKE